ncbi:MAG: PAS domain S-box protein [Gammaproteobacteria bacterium]|nr:PAS domain S-box protein [Gammaproteobacteria bacterium]MDH5799298.1 PAS domain S-box protein [Gammaproteobacteria bacterium]
MRIRTRNKSQVFTTVFRSVYARLIPAFLCITLSAWTIAVMSEGEIKGEVTKALSTVLGASHHIVTTWSIQNIQAVSRLADNPLVKDYIIALRNNKQIEPWKQQLLNSSLNGLIQTNRYHDYTFLGPDNRILASSITEDMGTTTPLLQQEHALNRLWSGSGTISTPIKIYPPGKLERDIVMYVGAPIRDDNGDVVALLLFTLNPLDSFVPLSRHGRIGDSGETYIFNDTGKLITESRFNSQLQDLGLIGAGEGSTLNLTLLDPGKNLLDTSAVRASPKNLPFTHAVANAIKGQAGIDLNGYRDYRGVSVVGAWLWDDSLNMGFTVEQDIDEAYAILQLTRTTIISGSILSMIILYIFAWSIDRNNKNLKQAEEKLETMFNTATDGIAFINREGIIENVNPAITSLLGYTKDELIGRNIKILMPEPFRSRHDEYLRRYEETGEKTVLGANREMIAQHRNGQLVSVDLSANEAILNGERHFFGILRDISDKVATKKKLQQANTELRMMAMVAQNIAYAVTITNPDGHIVWNNEGFTNISGLSEQEVYGQHYCHILEQQMVNDGIISQIHDAMLQQIPLEMEIQKQRRSAGIYWVNTEISPILNEQGQWDKFIIIEQDITEKRQLVSQIQQAKDKAERIADELSSKEQVLLLALSGAGAGHWYLELDSGKLHWDERCMEIFGICSDEFTGRYSDWARRVHPTDFPAAQVQFIDAMDNVDAYQFTFDHRIVLSNEELHYVHISATIERAEDGTPLRVYGLYFDVTQARLNERVLQKAKEEADAANLAKSSFLAAMSHEIRTPMNGVVGMIDVLAQTQLNESQHDFINTIKTSAFSLLSIIDDILDFSKIEAGRLSLESIPVEFEELVESVGDTLLPMAYKKGVELLVFCAPELPAVIKADPVRIRQILFNLGGNALKFTNNTPNKHGRVVIRAEVTTNQTEQLYVKISVEDNGIGMTPEVQRQLFQPFVQGEGSITRRFGGTGLGLTICRRLVDMMGGNIEMYSQENFGSIFSVVMPLEDTDDDSAKYTDTLAGLNVILLDCNDVVAEIVERYLITADATPIHASTDNVDEILQSLSPSTENLIFIINNPKPYSEPRYLQKTELIQHLADRFRTHKPGFLLLGRGRRQTPRAQEGFISLDLDALHRNSFIKAIAACAGRDSLATPDRGNTTQPFIEQIPTSGELVLIAEDNETNQKVLLHQLGLLGCVTQVANNGREALELWQHNPYALILTDCHMPEMDGYELTRQIRSREVNGAHIPIIAITADALKGTHKQCLDCGMDDYLTKPVQLKSLAEKLQAWLPSANTGNATPEVHTANVHEQPAAAENIVDTNALIEVLGMDDPALLADFYVDFVRTSDVTINELLDAHTRHNAEDVGGLAHRLKSSARSVGANLLADCCLALEMAGKATDWPVIETEILKLPQLYSEVKNWIQSYLTQSNAA